MMQMFLVLIVMLDVGFNFSFFRYKRNETDIRFVLNNAHYFLSVTIGQAVVAFLEHVEYIQLNNRVTHEFANAPAREITRKLISREI